MCKVSWSRLLGEDMNTRIKTLSNFIWSVADILRGDFKQSQYGRIILPFKRNSD